MPQENLSEKVSVNMNVATLSAIDLLVDNGHYSNRSDFINQAVREALSRNQSTIDRIAGLQVGSEKREWFIGVYAVSREMLEAWHGSGVAKIIDGYGLLIIEPDCPNRLVMETVEKIRVRGRVRCTDELKRYYQLK